MKTAWQLPQETANKKRLYGIEARPPAKGGMLTPALPEIIVDTTAEVEALAGTLGILVMNKEGVKSGHWTNKEGVKSGHWTRYAPLGKGSRCKYRRRSAMAACLRAMPSLSNVQT